MTTPQLDLEPAPPTVLEPEEVRVWLATQRLAAAALPRRGWTWAAMLAGVAATGLVCACYAAMCARTDRPAIAVATQQVWFPVIPVEWRAP